MTTTSNIVFLLFFVLFCLLDLFVEHKVVVGVVVVRCRGYVNVSISSSFDCSANTEN